MKDLIERQADEIARFHQQQQLSDETVRQAEENITLLKASVAALREKVNLVSDFMCR